ncbi:unnamed protein product, partial [Didymodactylos carnosus]
LRDTDFYIPGDPTSVKKRAKNDNTKDLTKTIKYVDEEMRRVIIIAEQRGLSLPSLFAHEFTRAPLALCDNQNCDLMNQQKKSAAIDYLKQQFPSSFSSSCPTLKGKSALVIDGGSLLEIRPKTRNMTVRQYAEQLLTTVINRQFQQYDRIDVVFDSSESKLVKAFTRRHGNDLDTSSYDLQIDDRLEASYHKFLHKNRAIVAARVRDCWAKPALVELLPEGKLLVAAGPDEYAIKLKKNSSSEQDWLLQSDHVEADTRLLLHTNVIMIDEYKSVVIAATDTDVILLSIAHALTIQLENVIIKSFNSTTKTDTFINSMEIAKKLKHFSIDPIILIVLHALSGSDSTSFIKNITKVKFFRTFFNNWQRFTHLSDFLKTPLSKEAIIDAEKLLLTTYSTTTNAITLDHLRATMAVQSFKEKRKSIVLNLPPTSNSFTLHCLRAARQIKIWGNALEPYLHIQSPNELDGFETVDDQLKIKWISNSEHPADKKLVTCGKCTTGCKNSRCKCGSQNINCTIYCKCPSECCKNQSNHRMSQLSLYATLSQEESDVDDFADREESNLSEEEGQLHSSCNSVNFENDDHIRTQSHNLDMSVQADNDIDGTSFATEHVEHNYCSTSTEEEQEEEHQKWSRIPSKPTIPMSPISNCRSTIASPSQRVLRPRINATEASPNYSNFKLPISPANRSKSTTSTPVTRQCRQSIKSTKRTVSIVNDENALPQNPTSIFSGRKENFLPSSCSDSDGNEHPISTKFRGSSKASRRPLSDLTNQMPLISLRKTQPTKTANGSTITITCSSDQILKTRHTSYSNLSTLEHQESVELHMPRLVRDVVDMTSVNNKASALSSSLFDLSPTQPSIPELVMLATDNTTSRATKTSSLSIGNKNVSTEPSFNSGKRRSIFDDETLNSDIVSEEYNSPCEQLLETSNMFEIGTTINTSKAITVPYKKPSILDSVRRNRKIFSSSTKKRRTSSAAAPIPRRSNRKRPSSTCDVLPIDEEGSHLYENGFEELTGWLIDLLRKGVLVLMTDVKTQYAVILHRRNELVSDAVLRVDSIRSRLTTRFGNKLFFTKLNKRSGTYVAINDLSLYTKVALSSSLHYYNNNSIKIYETQADEKEKHKQCELIFDSIKLLRRSINENLHYFKHLRKSRSTLADFNSTMFWELLEKEIFGKSDNWLKIASVSYDIINCKNERLITPKHYLLANEIFRHERSAQLLSITNRLGHTCGYKTILRLQHEAAEKSKAAFSSLSIINRQRNQQYRHDFAVIVADNFDMNKETVHGENSLHILNQIIVQTPENDEILFIVTELLTEITDQISQTVQLLAQSLASEAVSPVISQLPTIHSNYDPFIDTSLDMKLLGYSISKYFEQQMKTSDPSSPTNLPLLSGFFASFLHFDKRPVHSITFCTPINDNPSLISAAESCLRSTKAELLDKNYQKEAIIVVDEKIYKNCTKVRRETMFEYHHITIYPGDFHLMKTTMIVIWDVLDGSGIALDQSIECSINKLGKGHGGISGKFHESTIDNWINSFSYRALLTSVLHEICGLETTNNNLNSHLECTPTRQAIDETDLAILLKVLKSEHLFSPSSSHARKLLSGKIIHEDIILNICTSFDRGQEALSTYIKERLIDKTVRFEEPLKAMLRL